MIFSFNKNRTAVKAVILSCSVAVLFLCALSANATTSFNVYCSASPSSANVGQNVNFVSSVSGGNGAFAYAWTGACTGTSANCSKTFTTAGIQTTTLTVTSGGVTKSANCPVNVSGSNPPPTPTLNVYCSSSPSSANVNQNVNFTSSVSGGTGNYNYAWSGACSGSSQNCSKTFSSSGIYTATLSVTSGNQTKSANCPVNVSGSNPPPAPTLNVYCSASPSSANVDQNVNFVSSVSGGNGTFAYSWSGVCSGSSQNCSKTFSNPGLYTATLTVSSGNQTKVANCPVNVTGTTPPPPASLSVYCAAAPTVADVGDTVSFRSSVSGGTGNYNYVWSRVCSGNSQDCIKSFDESGLHTATLTVTSGNQTKVANCPVTIKAVTPPPAKPLSVYCAATPIAADINESVNFSSTVSGGNDVYNYSWSGACQSSSPNCYASFPTAGIKTATLTVTSDGQTKVANCPVTVTAPVIPPPPPPVIKCTKDLDCGPTVIGDPFCKDNDVYQKITTNICNKPGTAASFCSTESDIKLSDECHADETCNHGTCKPIIHKIVCDTDLDCGVSKIIGLPFCQGNAIYQNYDIHTCNLPGTDASYCSAGILSKPVSACTPDQSCNSGICVPNQSNLSVSCLATPNPVNVNQTATFIANVSGGNGAYAYSWSGACAGSSQSCSNVFGYNGLQTATITVVSGGQTTSATCSVNVNQNQYCSYHAYQRCLNNALYWYDSCGNQQELIQICQNGCYNNSCNQIYNNANLSVTKQVRNLTTGTNWANSVYASPSDTVMFMITLQATSGQDIQNVSVRDGLPTNLIYKNQLVVSSTNNYNFNNYSGDIMSGLNLYAIPSGQTIVITYQAQVADASNFSFETTTLTNNVTVSSSQLGYAPTSNASVIVTRAGVLGASTVSTGLTNNFWVDSFFLPLIIALLGFWVIKSGMFFGIEKWFDDRKKSRRNYMAERELANRISTIQKSEKA